QLDGIAPWVTAADHADEILLGATLADARQILVLVPRDAAGFGGGAPPSLMGGGGGRAGPGRRFPVGGGPGPWLARAGAADHGGGEGWRRRRRDVVPGVGAGVRGDQFPRRGVRGPSGPRGGGSALRRRRADVARADASIRNDRTGIGGRDGIARRV